QAFHVRLVAAIQLDHDEVGRKAFVPEGTCQAGEVARLPDERELSGLQQAPQALPEQVIGADQHNLDSFHCGSSRTCRSAAKPLPPPDTSRARLTSRTEFCSQGGR